MPINATQLQQAWEPRVASGLVNDFLCPVGRGEDAWVGQFMFDAGRWTLQVRPDDIHAFLEAHPGWAERDDGAVFRNIPGDVPLKDICTDVTTVVSTLETSTGPLEIAVHE